MPKHNNTYTITFVSVIAVVCSLLLSTAATSLREKQQANIALDKKKNILKSFGALPENVDAQYIESFYTDNIETLVVDHQGNEVDGNADDIDLEAQEKNKPNIEDRIFPVYVLKENNKRIAYTIPIIGKGLWSTLYGYFSLNSDLNEVRGITFYKHGETPGLGAEIEAAWFQDNFKGKKILDDQGNLASITVVKGMASDYYDEPVLSHHVDGISGATITSRGVTDMLKKHLSNYTLYFEQLRSKGD